MAEQKKLTVAEFRKEGYLQELNRQFLHPLGLALEVVVEEDGTERFGEVWDAREDEEGMIYGSGMIDPRIIDKVKREWVEKGATRMACRGYIIQKV